MAKSKEAKEDEFYKSIIRSQKKEIKSLKQRIRQLEKFEHLNNSSDEEDEPLERLKQCPECGKGFIKEMDLVGRLFEVCSLCDYRSKVKVMKRRKKHGR